MGSNDRYIFGITGTVKEIIFPSKAILAFKYKGKDEKAILLVHKFLIDGNNVDEQKLMSDILKVGDVVEFDGHIYDKGGYGGGKDRCNYYAMRAWKAAHSKVVARDHQLGAGKSNLPALICGTGVVKEVYPRKGVLIYERDGVEERVLFLASKFYHFEKRLTNKQALDQFLSEGDHVQFEAVPNDCSENIFFCSWFAPVVWKGKKPFEENSVPGSSEPVATSRVSTRRGSIGSTGSMESSSTEGSDSLSNNQSNTNIINLSKSGEYLNQQGYIAGLVNENCGLIWWVLQPNHLQGVTFQDTNSQDLRSIFKTGDPVRFRIEKSEGGPTRFIAKDVILDPAGHLNKHNLLPANGQFRIIA